MSLEKSVNELNDTLKEVLVLLRQNTSKDAVQVTAPVKRPELKSEEPVVTPPTESPFDFGIPETPVQSNCPFHDVQTLTQYLMAKQASGVEMSKLMVISQKYGGSPAKWRVEDYPAIYEEIEELTR